MAVDVTFHLRAGYHGDQLEPHRLPQWTSTTRLRIIDISLHGQDGTGDATEIARTITAQ